MLKFAAIPLSLAAILTLTNSAQAGGRYDRDYLPPAPPPVSSGVVNNFYGPTTVYQGSAPAYGYSSAAPAYPAPAYSAYGDSQAYGSAWASSSAYGSYGASYGAPWGEPFAGGVGYSPYGYSGGYGYGPVTAPVYGGARMDPWNGYYGGPGNGYW